jgi:lipopolysaccharide transport system ATP-binding protein
MADALVKVENVSKKFCRDLKKSLWYGVKDVASEFAGQRGSKKALRNGEFWSVNDVSFELKRGECVALIGPNGAGKSTLLKMLNGLIKPDGGRITIGGRVGALIELGAGFNPILTGLENIYVNGAVLGFTKKEIDQRLDEILEFADIGEFIHSPVQNYSSGMRVRLGFAVAANMNPDVLLVDEVLAVGDVGFRMKCYDFLLRLMDNGTSIIVVSHAVNQLSRITDRAIVLNHGKTIFDGSLAVGTGKYEHLLKIGKETKNVENQGKPSIESIRLTDTQGKDKTDFLTGESLLAEITLSSAETICDARLIVAVESPSAGILGAFSTPYSGFSFDVNPPNTTIKLEMPNLPLLIGGYYLNINFYGPRITEFYDKWAPGVPFKVIGPPVNAFGFGVNNLFKFEHRWE